jgi:hypothetical protein
MTSIICVEPHPRIKMANRTARDLKLISFRILIIYTREKGIVR